MRRRRPDGPPSLLSVTADGLVATYQPHAGWESAQRRAVTFAFDAADPFAVTMIVCGVPWTFARDLIAAPIDEDPLTSQPHGDGDVATSRMLDGVLVRLTRDGCIAMVTFPLDPLRSFMGSVEAACPNATASYDVDAVLAQLLKKGEPA